MTRLPGLPVSVERKVVLFGVLFGVLLMGVAAFVTLREIKGRALVFAEKQLLEATKRDSRDLLDQLDHAAWEMHLRHQGKIPDDGHGLVESLEVIRDAPHLDRPLLEGSAAQGLLLTIMQGRDQLKGTIDLERLAARLGGVPAGVERCLELDGATRRCSGSIDAAAGVEAIITASWQLPLSGVYETAIDLKVTSREARSSALEHAGLFPERWVLSSLLLLMVTLTGGIMIVFNRMTRQFSRSFAKMEGLARIDRAILDRTDVEEVVRQALELSDGYYDRTTYAYLWEDHRKQGRLLLLDGDELVDTPLCLLPPEGGDRSRVDHREALEKLLGVRFGSSAQVRVEQAVTGELLLPGNDGDEARSFQTLAELADRISVAATDHVRARSLYRQANYDSLTGLVNRQAFTDRVAEALRRAARSGQRGAILFLDLDRFKRVNDTEGHLVGDELLREVAARLRREVRETDTVSRLGGDEFAIIVPECGSETLLVSLCRRLMEAISRPFEVDRLRHEVDVSIGVSIFPDDGEDVGTLLMKADVAMYEAKSQNGSAFSFYDGSLNEENELRVRIESDLREAFTDGRLKLHYQPKLELASMRIRGLEGLLRWSDDGRITYGPEQFIPVAEETGLIHRFTELLVAESAVCLRRCSDMGFEVGRIALNISTRQIVRQGFARSFLAMLESAEVAPENLELEITESVFIEDAAHVTLELAKLREAGVRIALDDFGTGYSSLNMLRALPLDTVKIDRSFIAPLRDEANARKVTQKIIEMVSAFDLEVVAEGVEHWQEVSLLDRLGCHYVQGYVLERPLPLDELLAFLARVDREGFRAEYQITGATR